MLKGAAATAVLAAIILSIIIVRSGGDADLPEQPIAFSHKIHVKEYKMGCLYCHAGARKSAVAGVPSVQRCVGCHKNVGQDKAEVRKLAGYWEQKETIPWVKVYDVPDFVYFSHKRHLLGKVDCQSCHGPIETMDRIKKVGNLNMRRCVSCHIERKASIDCLTCHK